MKYETHEIIDDEVDENDLYELYKLSLDETRLLKNTFERELKIIYEIKRRNGMNHTHDNKVNNIAEYNLLNDILNPSKMTKNINFH